MASQPVLFKPVSVEERLSTKYEPDLFADRDHL